MLILDLVRKWGGLGLWLDLAVKALRNASSLFDVLLVSFSGGVDSQLTLELANLVDKPVIAVYVDAPMAMPTIKDYVRLL